MLDTHEYYLCFSIDNNAPIKYINKWTDLKSKCETGENAHIVEQIKNYCKMEVNRLLSNLDRYEGGIGGNNNKINKQIRFRFALGLQINDNDIILNVENTDVEKWTLDELDDIIRAFTKMANYNLQSECVTGYIKLINKKTLNDNYLNSDSDNE